ncbi:unnamed protein product [Brassica oleracea var. botrytis]|uniref:Uncharacterized protein n=2 Tax=Brassica TaxID=3705 RepID=A0A8X7QYR5_BRACI|nr:hypothetical protein Bca52824_058933 [Brassica carinata]CAF1739021.1 unnamed protein product [Brassica napus]
MWRIALPSSLFRVMSFGCVVVAQAFLGHNSEMGLAAYALLQRTFICFIYDVMLRFTKINQLCFNVPDPDVLKSPAIVNYVYPPPG